MKKFRLELKGPTPYPYIISEKGFVGRQKFWKGTPQKLLGFHSTPESGGMDTVTFIDKDIIIAEDIMLGINRYPVFADSEGGWFTLGTQVEKIIEVTK
jgi:hypothetical protein